MGSPYDWNKIARTISVKLGYSEKRKVRMQIKEQSFNDATNEHIVTFRLAIEHPVQGDSSGKVTINEMKFLKELLEVGNG